MAALTRSHCSWTISNRKPYYHCILIDDPRPSVRRITLNRPEKRNALNNQPRTEILQVLAEAERDPVEGGE